PATHCSCASGPWTIRKGSTPTFTSSPEARGRGCRCRRTSPPSRRFTRSPKSGRPPVRNGCAGTSPNRADDRLIGERVRAELEAHHFGEGTLAGFEVEHRPRGVG